MKKSLNELRAEVIKEASKNGCTCPVCHQFVKIYRRKFNPGMADILDRMYSVQRRVGRSKFFHVSRELVKLGRNPNSQEYSKLRYWGLIERGDPGFWRVTEAGMAFVEGKAHVKQTAVVFDGKVYGFDGKTVFINDVLRRKFDLTADVMGG